MKVAFTETVSGRPGTPAFQWNFGDGSSSTANDPSHTFATPGNFTVTLKSTYPGGAVASAQVKISVTKDPSALSVTISTDRTTGTAPLVVGFASVASGGSSPYAYAWNFGGGVDSTSSSPTHTFQYAGSYHVSCAVTDGSGTIATASTNIQVQSAGSNALTASASGSPSSGTAPLAVAFSPGVSGGHAPYAFAWTFGDGATSTQADPSHTYSGSGTFDAQVTVTDTAGTTARSTVAVVVSTPLSGSADSLVTGPLVASTPSTFWSVDAQTSCATCIDTNQSVKAFLGSTPFTWVRYGQGIDACNISAGLSYSAAGVASSGCGFDLSSLKSWCDATTPHCHTIISLPGENNNSREDAAIARWIVQTVGIQPDYWSIGNEPTGWTHYGIPWGSWKSTDASAATALAYAFDVKAAIAAVTAVDPAAKFIGIEAACSCNTLWFQDVARIDGASLAAFAFHSYPSSGSTTETLSEFYAPLGSSSNVTNSVATVRSAITGECTACAKLPIFVNEYNAGPGWAPSNYAGTYANAVFLAASVAQALTSNVSQLTVFNLENGGPSGYGFALLDSRGSPGPTGMLYSELLRHLAIGSVFAAHVATTEGGVWSVVTTNATTESILIVNTNVSHALTVSLGISLLSKLTATLLEWNSSLGSPLSSIVSLVSRYTVPSQGILLVSFPKLLGLAPLVEGAGPVRSVGAAPGFGPASMSLPGLVALVGLPSGRRPIRLQ